jgi:hypothetical protein
VLRSTALAASPRNKVIANRRHQTSNPGERQMNRKTTKQPANVRELTVVEIEAVSGARNRELDYLFGLISMPPTNAHQNVYRP